MMKHNPQHFAEIAKAARKRPFTRRGKVECLSILETIKFIKGELSPDEQRSRDQHVLYCLDCSRRIESLRHTAERDTAHGDERVTMKASIASVAGKVRLTYQGAGLQGEILKDIENQLIFFLQTARHNCANRYVRVRVVSASHLPGGGEEFIDWADGTPSMLSASPLSSSQTLKLVLGKTALDFSQPEDIERITRIFDQIQVDILPPTHPKVPLVGREEEVASLFQCVQRVESGTGQVVFIKGEAGIGKSRLTDMVRAHVAQKPYPMLMCRCYPYYNNSALAPIIDLLRTHFGFHHTDSNADKLKRLSDELLAYDQKEALPLFAALLSVELPTVDAHPMNLSPQMRKHKLLSAIVDLLVGMATHQPMLLVIEDLHWADASTLELLSYLKNRVPDSRMLVLLTYRPEGFSLSLETALPVTEIELRRLSDEQVQRLAQTVAKNETLPVEVVESIVVKAAGIPLWVETLTHAFLSSRDTDASFDRWRPMAASTLPDLSVMEQLSDLGPNAKAVAQLGATWGQKFPLKLLTAASPLDPDTLNKEVDRLMEAELLYPQPEVHPGERSYAFKHALIQEAIYSSLSDIERQKCHAQIAQALEAGFHQNAFNLPELVADHYTKAGQNRKAIGYWQQAGERAIASFANPEAIAHLKNGLALVETLPQTPKRILTELQLQLTLGVPLVATQGYAAHEVGTVYARVWELFEQQKGRVDAEIMDNTIRFDVLRGLWQFYLVRGDVHKAHELSDSFQRLAQSQGDDALLAEAHGMLGTTWHNLGEFASAKEHLERGIAHYDSCKDPTHLLRFGQDVKVTCLSMLGWTLWLMGYPQQALIRAGEAVEHARKRSHPFSLAFALFFASIVHQLRGEPHLTLALSEQLIQLSENQGFAWWKQMAAVMKGWAWVEQGRHNQGAALLEEAVIGWQHMGAELGVTHFLSMLAEAAEPQKALSYLNQALMAVKRSGEGWYEANLHRLKGEFLLRQGADEAEAAEACFRQGITVAQHQGSRSLELRATVNLSRLLQKQGQTQEAREMLAEIYAKFTEGLSTADLKAAKVQLNALS